MEERELFARMSGFENWVNLQLLEVLNKESGGNEEVLKLLAHNLQSQLIWLSRLEGRAGKEHWWPQISSVEECRSLAKEAAERSKALLKELTHHKLSEKVTFNSFQGPAAEVAVRDILLQLIIRAAPPSRPALNAPHTGGQGSCCTQFSRLRP